MSTTDEKLQNALWLLKAESVFLFSWEAKNIQQSVFSNTLSCLDLKVQLIIVFFAYSCKTEVWMILKWDRVKILRYSGLSEKDVLQWKRWFIFVSCHIYYCEKATMMAIRTKAWTSHCTNMKINWCTFVIISACSSQTTTKE